jgi:VCBS repeat-containing protein
VITASYGGDAQFAGDTDTENHRVDLVPVPNTPPTAAFTAPTNCVAGQPCQFTDESTDNGSIASRQWTFQDGAPATSNEATPSVTFASEGSKTVTLTVTDNEGASDSETKQVSVAPAAPPPNQAPIAGNDAFSTPGGGQGVTVPVPGVLANDSDPDGGAVSAVTASDPALGSVSLNPDGSFTYTPDLGATGSDSFTYAASDGSLTTPATVTITITP